MSEFPQIEKDFTEGWEEGYKQAKSEDAATITRLEAKVEMMQKVISWANNSLYGSNSFFLSPDGGPDDEHHLDRMIEELKKSNRKLSVSNVNKQAEIERYCKKAVIVPKWGVAEPCSDYWYQMDTPFGRYKILDRGEYGFAWKRPGREPFMGLRLDLNDAKAAAENDYVKRVRAALNGEGGA